VRTESEFAVQIPHLGEAAIAMLILGLVVAGGGIALMAIPGSGSRGRSARAPGATQSYAVG
jgi:hypothetical protein